jgi:ppGpp synthetase/RelA/SpoT-type nucleotidyltranferase
MIPGDAEIWLKGALPKHERLKAAAILLLENLLKETSIEYLSVTGRVKDFDSASEKIGRKNYEQPEMQLTDLTGIRVVTFDLLPNLPSFIRRVCSSFAPWWGVLRTRLA